ncbi:EpsG family protein [Herbinix luporum]|uniref:EpsG family protein n=1 Tax=Herbinix luporum TaxID=1679721 RepID=UPI0023543225|nr:EpsG family protein [Bacillota bacterium]
MKIYLLNILLLIIYSMIFLQDTPRKNHKIFCLLASLNWIILSGLRDLSIGPDTLKYGYYFEKAKNISWATLWSERVNIFIHETLGKDPGYIVFQKIIQLFAANYRAYLIAIALIFTVPLGIWIYKNSANPLMSFIIYSCLFYSFFSITGTRQTVATAMVVFIGYKFIKKGVFLPFLLLVLIAMTIHFSAICYLPFYFIANKEITNRYLLLYGSIFMGTFIFRVSIFRLGSKLIGYDQYLPFEETGTTWTFSVFLMALTILTLLKKNEILKNNKWAKHYINALLIAALFVPLTFVNPAAMRVIQYYSLFIILLVPEIINSFPKRERFFVFFVAASTLILLLIKNNPTYMFFWQL